MGVWISLAKADIDYSSTSAAASPEEGRLPNHEAQNHYTTGLFPADSIEKLSTLRRPHLFQL